MLRPQLLISSLGLMFVPILDATIKGTVVLLLAGLVCLILRRDSAATRHLVWTTAVMLLLSMPLLSLLLPQWRVLPNWPQVSAETEPLYRSEARIIDNVGYPVESSQPQEFEWTAASDADPIVLPPDVNPARAGSAPTVTVESEAPTEPGFFAEITARPAALISLAWLAGCALVLTRLFVALLFQRHSASRCVLLSDEGGGSSTAQNAHSLGDRELLAALETSKSRMGIKRPIQLLLDPGPSMPVVWGLMRVRLRLPAESVEWSAERQESVLMHELAHVRRNDLVILMMTHLACALNWFNPLMWVAAWRLHVERERACDDLVLSMGIKPSTYAGHLVEVVSRLRPAEWARSCGLAMARKSSLESRLTAVLSGQINRRGLTRLLIAAVFVIGTGIAIPVAMLHATDNADDKAEEINSEPEPELVSTEEEYPIDRFLKTAVPSRKLDAAIEEKLQWGEPVNGLRAALVRPQALGEESAGEVMDFRFVVQNVSDKRVRLSTASVAPTRRYLLIRQRGIPLSALTDNKPTATDFLIEPGEVAIMRLFSQVLEGASMAGGNPKMSYTSELEIGDAPKGSWIGKLVPGELFAASAGYGLLPKTKAAKELFIIWSKGSRRNETIPGGLIGLLAESVQTFANYNPTHKSTPRLYEILPRLDATRDWSGPEAIELLDELATLQDSPIKMALDKEMERTIHTGTPLPPELNIAPWGEAHSSGLRLAWLLEPQAKDHPVNSTLKSRLLIHNSGKNAVVFRTQNWHQVPHTATVNDSVEIEVFAANWLTLSRLLVYRLNPGEFIELPATGIGLGKKSETEDWRDVRVGTWINARVGEELTITTDPVPFFDGNDDPLFFSESPWWLDLIKARLSRYEPIPEDAEERKLLLYRVAMDLFGTPVSSAINESFVNDHEANALDSLAKRLVEHPGTIPFTGSLTSGPTTFRVLPADLNAEKKPRIVHNPGRYKLGENIVLTVSRRPVDDLIVNEASIRFYSSNPAKPVPSEPYKLTLPRGYSTWAVSWLRGGTTLYLQEKSGYRKIDFADPSQVVEEAIEANDVPEKIREATEVILSSADMNGRGGTPAASTER